MREIISIHIGQAGVNLGAACWDLYCAEHGLGPDGTLVDTKSDESIASSSSKHDQVPEAFFQTTSNGKHVPRALFIDLDPDGLDVLREGHHKSLFSPNQMLRGSSSAVTYGEGCWMPYQELHEARDKIRKLVEQCSSFQGFMYYHSVSGGTGAGFASRLLYDDHSSDYNKKTKFDFCLFPTPHCESSVIEPYNAVLSMQALCDDADVVVPLDNRAIRNVLMASIRRRQTRSKTIDQSRSSEQHHQYQNSSYYDGDGFSGVNRAIAQVISSMTLGSRLNGPYGVDLNDAIVFSPYPKIHFLTPSYAPFHVSPHSNQTVTEITSAVMEPENTLLSCGPRQGKHISSTLMYRGECAVSEVQTSIQAIKDKSLVQFVDWSPIGFKTGITHKAPVHCLSSNSSNGQEGAPRIACASLSNTTAIHQVFSRLLNQFDTLMSRRAFIHWFLGGGMEMGEFWDAEYCLKEITKDYKELEASS